MKNNTLFIFFSSLCLLVICPLANSKSAEEPKEDMIISPLLGFSNLGRTSELMKITEGIEISYNLDSENRIKTTFVNNERIIPSLEYSYVKNLNNDYNLNLTLGSAYHEKMALLLGFGIDYKVKEDIYVGLFAKTYSMSNNYIGMSLSFPIITRGEHEAVYEHESENLAVELEVDDNKSENLAVELEVDDNKSNKSKKDIVIHSGYDNLTDIKQTCEKQYSIKKNEYLWKVALRLNLSPEKLIKINNEYFKNIDLLYPGQVLCLY